MFKRYNSDKVIKGPFVGATFDTRQLSIYTQDPDGYGTMIQAADGQTYPFGQVMGSVQSLTFTEKPTAVVKAKNNQIKFFLTSLPFFHSRKKEITFIIRK